MTNADVIRSMSDAELADFIKETYDVGYLYGWSKTYDLPRERATPPPYQANAKKTMDWLQQEVDSND